MRSANLGSIVYGASLPACADHFTGRRTVAKPAFFIVVKYSALSVTPHSPSFGASRALPRLMPRPRLGFDVLSGWSPTLTLVSVNKTPKAIENLIGKTPRAELAANRGDGM